MPPRSPVRHGALAAALALLVLAGVRPGSDLTGARALGPLPDCRYDDIMTTPRGYDDWPITLVDTILRVPRGYVPPDLVSVKQAGIAGSGKVRAVMIDDLRAMAEAAEAAGNAIGVYSAYRSYTDQVATFNSWVATSGYQQALRFSARPGHSEHQLGLAIDFRSEPGGSPFTGSWGKTPAGSWMGAHAWEYGFIRSYPAKKQALTCYASEAWHYRYVGRDLAASIHGSGLTLREYLWFNYTTTVVPAVTPGPGQTPRGTHEPSAAPSGLASPSPSASAGASGQVASPAGSPPAGQTSGPGTSVGQASSGPGTNPGGSPPPIDVAPVADLDPAVAVSVGAVLLGILALTVLALRRGRSGQSG